MSELEKVIAKIKQKATNKEIKEWLEREGLDYEKLHKGFILGFKSGVNKERQRLLGVLGEWQKRFNGYPKAVCLVGSTHPKWKRQYRMVEEELTKAGFVVISVVWFKDELPNFEDHRDLLERIHFQKIRLSNAVVLIHKDAVGKHTAMEMEFARKIGKQVVVFENIVKAQRELGVK